MVFVPQFLVACAAPEVVPPDLAPLEQNKAELPAPSGGDPHPEALEVVSGGDADLWWAHGAGYLHAPIVDVWAAAQDPDVDVDRREVDKWTVTDDPRPELDASYVIHHVVHDIVTVEYDVWWRHEAQAGTVEEPELVVAVWSKIDGTSFIDVLEYSMVLTPVEDDVTQIELVGHLAAAATDDQTIVSYLNDLFGSLVAVSKGDPLPTY